MRFRFVVVMQNHRGEVRRVRLVEWSHSNNENWRNMDKAISAALGGDSPESPWAHALMGAVESMKPKDVKKKLGRH